MKKIINLGCCLNGGTTFFMLNTNMLYNHSMGICCIIILWDHFHGSYLKHTIVGKYEARW